MKTPGELAPLDGGRAVPREELANAARWTPLTGPRKRRPAGFVELGELCRVHRGQVTGANAVWIAGAHSEGVPRELLFPSVTRARELFAAGGALVELEGLKRVIDFRRTWTSSEERSVARSRSSSARRDRWGRTAGSWPETGARGGRSGSGSPRRSSRRTWRGAPRLSCGTSRRRGTSHRARALSAGGDERRGARRAGRVSRGGDLRRGRAHVRGGAYEVRAAGDGEAARPWRRRDDKTHPPASFRTRADGSTSRLSRVLFRARVTPRAAAIIPLGRASRRASSSLPAGSGESPSGELSLARTPAYVALLPMGFAVPRALPRARWALTPPFHPYRSGDSCELRNGRLFCGTLLGVSATRRYLASCSVELGLSSVFRQPRRGPRRAVDEDRRSPARRRLGRSRTFDRTAQGGKGSAVTNGTTTRP